MRRIRQGAATEAYWASTVRERNAAGADAAALECHRIYELKVTAQVASRQDSQDEQDFHGAVGAKVTFAANHR